MQKLSGMDATFLYMETDETPMHISSLAVCEPAKDGENPYEALKSQIVERLHEIPSFHRKLMQTPLYIDHPVWVSAEEVDLEYHIKHASLPAPGNVEQLRVLVQGLHSLRLDRDRPLWQTYIIEGLEDPEFGLPKGSFALYTKGHHASLDGGAGVSAMDIISDREPTPRPPLPQPKNKIRLQKEKPGPFELLGTAYGKFVQQQADLVAAIPALAKAVARLAKVFIDDIGGTMKALQPAPKTRFNVRIEKQRAFGAQSLPLAEVIAVAKKSGATLNDVVLTICGGALRRYLEDHGELPKQSLVAAVPVSLREVGDTSNTNQVSGVACEIATDVSDPLERLKAVNESATRAKKQLGAVRDVIPTDFSFFGAPILMTAMAQMASNTDIANYMPSPINVTISNVPGPRRPMYFAGSKVLTYFPVSIPTHGCALNITLQSYVDRIDFGLVACKKAVPDVQNIADYIVDEFRQLESAVNKMIEAGPAKNGAAAKPKAAPKADVKKPAAKKAAAKKAPARKPAAKKPTSRGSETRH